MSLTDRLRAARKRAGLTQAEAAAAIDVARTTMVAIEQGARRLTPAELLRLAISYGVDPQALAEGEPPPAATEAELYLRGAP